MRRVDALPLEHVERQHVAARLGHVRVRLADDRRRRTAGDAEAVRIGEVRLVAAQPVACRRQIVVVDEHEQIAACRAHASVARARAAERVEPKDADARVARERVDARDIVGWRTVLWSMTTISKLS